MREEINRGKPCLFVCFRFTADNDRMFKFIQHGTSHVPIWLVCRHLQSHYLGVLVWLLKVQFQSSKHVWSVPVLAPTLWNALSADVPELKHQDEVNVCVTERESPGVLYDSDVIVAPICIRTTTRIPEHIWKILKSLFSFHLTPRTSWVTSHTSSEHTRANTTRCCTPHAVLKHPQKMTAFKNLM